MDTQRFRAPSMAPTWLSTHKSMVRPMPILQGLFEIQSCICHEWSPFSNSYTSIMDIILCRVRNAGRTEGPKDKRDMRGSRPGKTRKILIDALHDDIWSYDFENRALQTAIRNSFRWYFGIRSKFATLPLLPKVLHPRTPKDQPWLQLCSSSKTPWQITNPSSSLLPKPDQFQWEQPLQPTSISFHPANRFISASRNESCTDLIIVSSQCCVDE